MKVGVYFATEGRARLALIQLRVAFPCSQPRQVEPVQGRPVLVEVTIPGAAFPSPAAESRSLNRLITLVAPYGGLVQDLPEDEIEEPA